MNLINIANMIVKRKIILIIFGILIFVTPQIINQYKYEYLNKKIIFKEKALIRSIIVDDNGLIFQKNTTYEIIIERSSDNNDEWHVKLKEVKNV